MTSVSQIIRDGLHIARRLSSTSDKSVSPAEAAILGQLHVEQATEIARLRGLLAGRISEYAAGEEMKRLVEENAALRVCATPEAGGMVSRAAVHVPQWLIVAWYDAAAQLLQECDDWLKLKHGDHPSAAGLNFGETERRREIARLLFLDLAWLSGRSELDCAPERVAGIQLPAAAQGQEGAVPVAQEPVAFGLGQYCVDTGEYNGSPAVFIAPARFPGEVGASAKREGRPLNALVPGERVLTFPTLDQAKRVADALCNAHPPAPVEAGLADLIERLEKGVVASGMHEDNSTELYLVDDATDTMAEAAAALRAQSAPVGETVAERDQACSRCGYFFNATAPCKCGQCRPFVAPVGGTATCKECGCSDCDPDGVGHYRG